MDGKTGDYTNSQSDHSLTRAPCFSCTRALIRCRDFHIHALERKITHRKASRKQSPHSAVASRFFWQSFLSCWWRISAENATERTDTRHPPVSLQRIATHNTAKHVPAVQVHTEHSEACSCSAGPRKRMMEFLPKIVCALCFMCIPVRRRFAVVSFRRRRGRGDFHADDGHFDPQRCDDDIVCGEPKGPTNVVVCLKLWTLGLFLAAFLGHRDACVRLHSAALRSCGLYARRERGSSRRMAVSQPPWPPRMDQTYSRILFIYEPDFLENTPI